MIDASKLRAWYAHRQGLDGSLDGKSAAEVLQRAGWARSVGGVSPYLALFARAGITREQADAAARKLQIYELPSARGCTYVLPASDFALGLSAGQGFDGEIKTAAKLGVTEKEIDKLCDAVVAALEKGPLDPGALREATGKAVRNLGPEGKKKGLTTTLPVALGKLQESGDIRRVPINGRFDQQRYQYALWRPNPLRSFKMTPAEHQAELARRYFSWIGPAAAADFQRFSGLGVKAAKAALELLKLEPPRSLQETDAFSCPESERNLMPSSRRKSHVTHFSVASIRCLSFQLSFEDPAEGHAIVDRGRLIGLWEYDLPTESIAWVSSVKKDKALQQAVTRTEEFVRQQLGDARSFSLDSPKSRAPRIAALRKAAASA